MKGISPILASVLLLAVTISVAGVFSGWAPSLAQTVTEQTGNQTEQRLACNQASAEFISVNYDSGNSEVNLALRNDGGEDFSELILVAFNSEDNLLAQENISVDAGNVANTTISNVNSAPSYVNLYAQECSDVTDTIEL
jgi:flagellin-like protein